jgi:hypothetical protein
MVTSGIFTQEEARFLRRIMFDEMGEAQLHHTDLRARLHHALDGPHAWMTWPVPRAVARNMIYKLQNPPRKHHLGGGLRRVRAELELYWRSFPNLPEHAKARGYQDGNRIDDPEVSTTTDFHSSCAGSMLNSLSLLTSGRDRNTNV